MGPPDPELGSGGACVEGGPEVEDVDEVLVDGGTLLDDVDELVVELVLLEAVEAAEACDVPWLGGSPNKVLNTAGIERPKASISGSWFPLWPPEAVEVAPELTPEPPELSGEAEAASDGGMSELADSEASCSCRQTGQVLCSSSHGMMHAS